MVSRISAIEATRAARLLGDDVLGKLFPIGGEYSHEAIYGLPELGGAEFVGFGED
jgi:hypothetical protein